MSSPSKQDADLAAVQTEVHQMNEETQDAGLISSSSTAETDIDDISCLSPYQLVVPVHVAPEFPRVAVPAVLSHGGKNCGTCCTMERARGAILSSQTGKRFATDNNLKMGDACIFEVMESSDVCKAQGCHPQEH